MKRENGDLEAFVGDLQKGDEKAFRILFDEFYVALCLFAVRFMEDREAAADGKTFEGSIRFRQT